MSIPEWGLTSANGTATYSWNGDKIGSKTDAKGQRIDYAYDSYRRLSNVRRYQTGGAEDALQRTDYYYDSNPYDGSYSQNAVGRLTAVHYWIKADPTAIPAKIHEFIEMFSYTPAGQPTKKKLVVIKTTNSVPYAASLEVQYTYDGEGKLISVKHPDHYNSGGTVVTGKTLTYDYTEMARLKSMKEGTTDWVTGVTYNIAGQMTAMNGETRTYNVMGQMISMGGMQYNYPGAGANNGRIVSQTLIDGESVSYQYDSLNRLSSATGTGWSQGFVYDGFGNMTDQNGTGSAPSMHLVIDPVKNGGGADANGNNGGEVDIENRLVGMAANARAGYDASNKRVWDKRAISGGSEERVYFFGVDGKRLGEFVMRDVTSGGTVIGLRMEGLKQNYYFGSRLLRQNDEQIRVDRLGNVVSRQVPGQTAQTFKYYPYGQEYTVTAHEKEKFGTYWRDSLSGMDYADQRYYNYLNARFASTDQYKDSGSSNDPGSWNRYAHTNSDPVNRVDPTGQYFCEAMYSYEQCFGGSTLPGGEAIGICFDLANSMGASGLGYIQTISQCGPILLPGMPLLMALMAPPETIDEPVYDGGFDNRMKARSKRVVAGLSAACKEQLSGLGIELSDAAIDRVTFYNPGINGHVHISRFGTAALKQFPGDPKVGDIFSGGSAGAVTTWGPRPGSPGTNGWILGPENMDAKTVVHELMHAILRLGDADLANKLYGYQRYDQRDVLGPAYGIAEWLQPGKYSKCNLP
ncbi:MAG: RHS repeat-associated core domain-containing protein [Bryobacteraceae bacterium]